MAAAEFSIYGAVTVFVLLSNYQLFLKLRYDWRYKSFGYIGFYAFSSHYSYWVYVLDDKLVIFRCPWLLAPIKTEIPYADIISVEQSKKFRGISQRELTLGLKDNSFISFDVGGRGRAVKLKTIIELRVHDTSKYNTHR